jgi:hypothetical protein
VSRNVFISSTSKDLLKHRKAVVTALLNAGYHPIDMANFMARPDGAVDVCLDEVRQSDLFIGIYAYRYGFIPPQSEVSITEMEFNEARRLKKPCFCFMVDERCKWPEKYRDTEPLSATMLEAFKKRVDSILVRTTFTTPADLASKVLASLQRWERERRDPETLIQQAREQLSLASYETTYRLAQQVLMEDPSHPAANLLSAIAIMRNQGVSRVSDTAIKRIINHLKLAQKDKKLEPTALAVLGIIKYDRFISNGLAEGEPRFREICSQLSRTGGHKPDLSLLTHVAASSHVKQKLGID